MHPRQLKGDNEKLKQNAEQ